MTSLSKQRPVQEFRGLGNIKVAVWKREHEGWVFYTYGPERGYKDKNGTLDEAELAEGLNRLFAPPGIGPPGGAPGGAPIGPPAFEEKKKEEPGR